MSKEQAKEFFYEVAKNKELAEKVSQLMGSAASKAVAEKLISIAQEYGFNFTKEEAAIAQRDFKIPLSEEDLEKVSGGFFGALAAVVTFALTAFAGASYLTSECQPNLSSLSQIESISNDVSDEDIDELHPAMFDTQAEDEDNNDENDTNQETSKNDYDEDSNPLLKTIRNEKTYKESLLNPFWSNFLHSRTGVNEETSERDQLILEQLKEDRMNEMRYANPPIVALSPGSGSGSGAGGNDDDNFKKQLQRKAENLLKKAESFERYAYVDFVPAAVPDLSSELESVLANLKVELPEKLTSDTQADEKTDDITESKIDEQKPVEQQ